MITPIIADPRLREGKDFRRPNDGEHVVRVNDRKPDGFSARPISRNIGIGRNSGTSRGYIAVTGTQNTQQDLIAFINGTDRHLELERDPKNEWDPHAIKVMGEWKDSAGKMQRARLGWVPAHVARGLANEYADCELAATIECMYRATATTSAGLRIDIWTETPDG